MSYKVCIDPGHGTKELNQSPDGRYLEYKMAWDLSNRIKALLEKAGCEVVLTKSTAEETPSLSARAAVANSIGADVLLSVHSNAVATKDADGDGVNDWNDTAHGLTAWIYETGGRSEQLAWSMLQAYAVAGVELFGSQLYTAHFTVLAKSTMPAVLIENYFHTCQGDVAKLMDDAELDKLACAAVNGICDYFGSGADLLMASEEDGTPEWADEAWEWAKSLEITDGTRPNDNETRAEDIVMLYRFAKMKGLV